MEMLRRTYGIAEPVRRGMELKIAREGVWRPTELQGGSGGGMGSVHEEILRGRDDTITWEDVYSGEEARGTMKFHDEMERKVKM
jgi:proteasome maturation protein